MFILNEYEVEDSVRRAVMRDMPVAEEGARRLRNLVDWTNANSDGWPYFRKPAAAAVTLQKALHARFFAAHDKTIREDMTTAELNAALRPIKAFLTRQGANWQEVFSRDY
jgi:hypothetical protein